MSEASTAAALIEKAFGLARRGGKPDWWAMAIPVLKNRLLLLTNNSFKEADYGATSFRDFLGKVPDIIRIDERPLPGFVILKSAAPERWEPVSGRKSRGVRIRPDLWRAVLDYSSGQRYVWDTARQTARPANPEEDAPVIPTISPVDLEKWRSEFVALHKTPNAEETKLVEAWSKNRLPTAGLPAPMRSIWTSNLKRKVEQRLQDWFQSNSMKAPAIAGEQEPSTTNHQEEALREFIVCCVNIMSSKELLELRISPSTALRVLKTKQATTESTENEGGR